MYMVYLWCRLLGFVQAFVRQASWINSLSLCPLVVSKTYNSHDKVLRVRLVSADNCSWYSSVVLFLQVEQETSQELELIVHTCSSDGGPWAKKVRKGNNDTIGGTTICWNSDCFWEEKGVQLQLDGWGQIFHQSPAPNCFPKTTLGAKSLHHPIIPRKGLIYQGWNTQTNSSPSVSNGRDSWGFKLQSTTSSP